MPLNKVISVVDTQRFGFPVAKGAAASAEDVEQLINTAKAAAARMLIARVPTHAIEAVHALNGHSAVLMDTLLNFSIDLAAFNEHPFADEPSVRNATREDAQKVESAARLAFAAYAGHYALDPRLPRDKVAEIYPSWASRSCTEHGVADRVLVLERNNEVLGFAVLRDLGDAGVDGVLYGVVPSARRDGCFKTLLTASLVWAKGMGRGRFTYSTQVTNVAAQHAISNFGFKLWKSEYTFHLWLEANG